MNVQEVQLNNINVTAPNQAARLRYGFGNYAQNRVQQDIYKLSHNGQGQKNPVEALYEKFLAKYNPNALMNRYMTEASVETMLQNAPVVKEILAEKGVNAVVCINNLKDIRDSHDIGKIMIPEEILNKNGKLNPEERAIVNTHSRIGYELLKTTGMDSKALSIVRNHHTAASMTNDKLSKIVSVADVYSALTEKRAYKGTMSSEDALAIMDSFVMEGKLDGQIVEVLRNSLQEEGKQAA